MDSKFKNSSNFAKKLATTKSWFFLLCLVTITALLNVMPSKAQTSGSGWTEPVDITLSSEGRFGFLRCDSYQNLHLVWADNSAEFTIGGALIYRAKLGEKWSQPNDVVLSDKGFYRITGIIEPNSDTLHVFWVNAPISGTLYHSQTPLRAASNPRSWTKPQLLQKNVQSASVAVDHEGTIHMLYDGRDSTSTRLSLYHTVSNDNGLTWSDPVVVYFGSTDLPSTVVGKLAVDGSGRLHVGVTVRTEEYGEYSEIHYLRSEDGGANWTQYLQIDPLGEISPGVSTLTPFAFGDDNIHLTWHNPRRMHIWSTDGGNTWSNPNEILSLGAAFGGANEIAQDSAGQLYAITAVASGVFVSPWNGSTWGTAEKIDDRNIDPHFQHLAACQGNQLHVVYHDRIGDNTVWYANKTVDAPSIDSLPIPQMVMDGQDNSAIAENEPNETELELESDSVEVTVPNIPKEVSRPETGMRPFAFSFFFVCLFIAVVIVLVLRRRPY